MEKFIVFMNSEFSLRLPATILYTLYESDHDQLNWHENIFKLLLEEIKMILLYCGNNRLRINTNMDSKLELKTRSEIIYDKRKYSRN